MNCLTLTAAGLEQLPLIRNLYWKLLDSSEDTPGFFNGKRESIPRMGIGPATFKRGKCFFCGMPTR